MSPQASQRRMIEPRTSLSIAAVVHSDVTYTQAEMVDDERYDGVDLSTEDSAYIHEHHVLLILAVAAIHLMLEDREEGPAVEGRYITCSARVVAVVVVPIDNLIAITAIIHECCCFDMAQQLSQ